MSGLRDGLALIALHPNWWILTLRGVSIKHRRLGTVSVAFSLFLGAVAPVEGAIYRVDDDADPGGDGSTWDLAYNQLYLILDNQLLNPGDIIWVAQGTYKPGTERTDSFNLVDEVKLLGGYAGLGVPNPDERNITLYETILSGDIEGDNCYHVVRSDGNAVGTIIDGFTIEHGMADGGGVESSGAGMLVRGAVAIVRCTFCDNIATHATSSFGVGGGIAFRATEDPTNPSLDTLVIDCLFHGNHAKIGGGAMFTAANCAATVLNTLFFQQPRKLRRL
jgi:hypothetical protein